MVPLRIPISSDRVQVLRSASFGGIIGGPGASRGLCMLVFQNLKDQMTLKSRGPIPT